MHVQEGWQRRLQEARRLYAERFADKPTFRRLAKEVGEIVGSGVPTSYPTVHRHFEDPGQRPRPELLRGLAVALAVREEWLLQGQGKPTREGQRRAQLAADTAHALRESVSEPFSFGGAGKELLVQAMRRWSSLPDYMFEEGEPPEPEEIAEEVAEIVRIVLKRLPRRLWSDDDWSDFSVALLGALMFGIKRGPGGTPKAAVIKNLDEFVSMGVPETRISRRE